jgi:hypothetical protein
MAVRTPDTICHHSVCVCVCVCVCARARAEAWHEGSGKGADVEKGLDSLRMRS